MATIKIATDVDASAFREFYATFQRYSAGMSAASEAWAAMASNVGKTSGALTEAADKSAALAKSMEATLKISTAFERISNRTSAYWGTMSRHTKGVATNIKEATVSLLKWSEVFGIVSGIVGFGGLALGKLGVDSMARSVGGVAINGFGPWHKLRRPRLNPDQLFPLWKR